MEKGDSALIRYLLRNRHGTPFEHGYFKFRVEAPIFTFREHHRHRVGHSYNEMSGRYTELEPKFYVPLTARKQEGKPGAYLYVEQPEDSELSEFLRGRLHHAYSDAWATYRNLLDAGIAKEQARIVLPVGIYTKMIWSCNPRSLMHFLGLRAEKSAQQEIQTVAHAAEKAFSEAMPVTYRAFTEGGRIAP
jgi:thymidylate synthase (FAD)